MIIKYKREFFDQLNVADFKSGIRFCSYAVLNKVIGAFIAIFAKNCRNGRPTMRDKRMQHLPTSKA